MSRTIITLIAAVALMAGYQIPVLAQPHDHMQGGQEHGGGHMSGLHSEEMMEQMHTMMEHMSEMMQEMHGAHEQMEGQMGDQMAGHQGDHMSMMQDMTHDMENMMPLMDSMLTNMRNYMGHDGDMSDEATAERMHEMMANMDRMFSAGQGMMQALQQMHGGAGEQGGDHAGHQH